MNLYGFWLKKNVEEVKFWLDACAFVKVELWVMSCGFGVIVFNCEIEPWELNWLDLGHVVSSMLVRC